MTARKEREMSRILCSIGSVLHSGVRAYGLPLLVVYLAALIDSSALAQ